jgi:hypothetical protein
MGRGCDTTKSSNNLLLKLAIPHDTPNKTDELAKIWHEYAHAWEAYQRFQQGVPCPYAQINEQSQTEEETRINFWSTYFEFAVRKFYAPTKSGYILKDGVDFPAAVYNVFVPNNLDDKSPLFTQVDKLRIRYIPLSTLGQDKSRWSDSLRGQAKTIEDDWNKFLGQITPSEKKAVRDMIAQKIVAPDFFPTLP